MSIASHRTAPAPDDWRETYESRRTTASSAVTRIQSGMTVGSGHFAGEPVALLRALCAQKERLRDVTLVHMNGVMTETYAYATEPGWEGHVRHTSLFAGKETRRAVQDGRADFVPCFFSDVPRLFRERHIPLDACFVQLSMPDPDGYCSFGVSCDYAPAMIESAGIVLAELNRQMPFTFGERAHVSKLHVVVETDRPLPEVKQTDNDGDTSVAERIAGFVAALIPDGANLQLGIGAIPDTVLRYLKGKKDLGVHSEMFSDGILELLEAGVLTCANNRLHPGKIVACFVAGSSALYRFIDRNPRVLMKPVDYTNSVLVASRVDKLVSINSAVQVSFHGEVAADTLGPRQFSGIGGQVDFVRAASLSNGGFSVIALPSTAKNGTISRIVPMLTPGACVTTSRADVNWVATEHGCVNLRGRTIRDRTQLLISLAHPDFRASLRKDAVDMGFLRAEGPQEPVAG
jgi:4-hydroxybutyrate CoA-transferase